MALPVRLESTDDGRKMNASAVQPAFHRGNRDLQNRGRLVTGEPVELAQREHLTLVGRKPSHGRVQQLPPLLGIGLDWDLWQTAPSGLFGQLLDRLQLGRLVDSPPHLMVHRVARNGVQPRPCRIGATIPGRPAPCCHEGVLHGIVDVGRAGITLQIPAHERLVPSHEQLEGTRVTGGRRREQPGIVGHDDWRTLQVEKPSSVYKGQLFSVAVSSGMKPR